MVVQNRYKYILGSMLARNMGQDVYKGGKYMAKRAYQKYAGSGRARGPYRSPLATKKYVNRQIKVSGYAKAIDYQSDEVDGVPAEIPVSTFNTATGKNVMLETFFGQRGPYFNARAAGREFGRIYLTGVKVVYSFRNLNANFNAFIDCFITYSDRGEFQPSQQWFQRRNFSQNETAEDVLPYSTASYPVGTFKRAGAKNTGPQGAYQILKHKATKLGINAGGGSYKAYTTTENWFHKFKKPIYCRFKNPDQLAPDIVALNDFYPHIGLHWTANGDHGLNVADTQTNVVCDGIRVTWYYREP